MELKEALITGAFGIAVAVVTWLLAGLNWRKQART